MEEAVGKDRGRTLFLESLPELSYGARNADSL